MRRRFALIAIAAALAATPAIAVVPAWQVVGRSQLLVTSGAISQSSPLSTLHTSSAVMRAVERDNGHHARQARLRFRFLGNSPTTAPLGSGLIVRQIGLKIRAGDPCNLLYVMWRDRPSPAIVISVKRNPGQTTSAQCGNRGYTTLATIPVRRAPGALHALRELRVNAFPVGASLGLRAYRNGAMVYSKTLAASLVGGLNGPVGVRSDNGNYTFQLAVADRAP